RDRGQLPHLRVGHPPVHHEGAVLEAELVVVVGHLEREPELVGERRGREAARELEAEDVGVVAVDDLVDRAVAAVALELLVEVVQASRGNRKREDRDRIDHQVQEDVGGGGELGVEEAAVGDGRVDALLRAHAERAEETLPGGQERERQGGEPRVEPAARRAELGQQLIEVYRQLAGERARRTRRRRRLRDRLLDPPAHAGDRLGRRRGGGLGRRRRLRSRRRRGGDGRRGGHVVAVGRGHGRRAGALFL